MSFNYDTIFEYSLPNTRRWFYQGVNDRTNALALLKPHGSINWEDGQTIDVVKQPERCVIVAPTHLKFVQTTSSTVLADNGTQTAGYLDQSDQIRQIWSRMEKEMRQAKALVFIGYSFPVADLYFASVLRSVLASRDGTPAIVVVNPDAVAIRDRLRMRFPVDNVLPYFDLGTFLQSNRKQLMKQLGRLK